MSAAFRPAATGAYALVAARTPAFLLDFAPPQRDRDGLAMVDFVVSGGRVDAVGPGGHLDLGDLPRLNLGGGLALPLFVDAHTHLDKGQTWARAPNPDGSFSSALKTVTADREAHWSAPDVEARMEFALAGAYAHGTRAIRTHIDSISVQTAISWPVFAKMRERWRGRIDLQGAPLFSVEHAEDAAHMAEIERAVDRCGTKILGAVTYMIPTLHEGLEAIFALAERKGWDLDFHVDESLDPSARSLDVIAETASARRFAAKILVGHCCSLAIRPTRERDRAISLVAAAGLSVVSLPMCNLYLQDRVSGRTPLSRGVTALHELRAAGVNVTIASDNTRDPFYAYGDLDMLEVWREGVRILHLDHPISDWWPALIDGPAAAMGLAPPRWRSGVEADFILTRARSATELFARPHVDRTVLRAGLAIPTEAPDYTALDGLKGLRP